MGIPVPWFFCIIGVNPVSQMLNDLCLRGNSYFKNSLEIVAFDTVSFVLYILGTYMFFKYVFLFMLIPCIIAVANVSLLHMFNQFDTTKTHSEDYLARHFESIRLGIVIAKKFIGYQTLYSIMLSQILLTILAWLSINCYRMLPAFVVAVTVAGFLGCSLLAVFLLTMIATAGIISKKIIQRKRAQFSGRFSGVKLQRKYLRAKWRSQQPLPLYCGTHFAMDKDAVMNYFNVLTDNTTSTILLLEP